MPRFCANLSMLFTEVDFLERFDAAAKALRRRGKRVGNGASGWQLPPAQGLAGCAGFDAPRRNSSSSVADNPALAARPRRSASTMP